MKELLKNLIKATGYTPVKNSYHKNLVNVNTLSSIDCHYILQKVIAEDKKICCFDIGANVGQTAKKFKHYYPNSTIYCFEPMKKTFEQLNNNVKAYANIKTHNCAMGSKQEQIEVYYQDNSEWNTLITDNNAYAKGNGGVSEIVQVDTVDHFVKKEKIGKIDLLKSDTEGFELEVLKGAAACLAAGMIDALYFEVGFSKADKQHVYWVELAEYLEKYNYAFSGLFEVSYNETMRMTYGNALFFHEHLLRRHSQKQF